MSDELLPYYHRELAFLRRLGAEFAEAHPKIAARLRLGPDAAEDPHVERLIEAAAYLNARTRLKLDDDFPEITDALLGVLYPHYQAPLPAMAVVRFFLDRGQADLVGGYTIPRETPLETDPIDGEPCRFRTCYPTTLWPIDLKAANLAGRPFAAPAAKYTSQAVAVLRLQLQCFTPEMTFSKLSIGSLRFFLRGQSQHVFPLYELIFNNVLGVALADSPTDRNAVVLGPQCIRPVGFERDEGVLPWPNRSFLGYRILSEYFAFPQKFLFFDLVGLDKQVLQRAGNRLELYLYLNRSSVDLEQNVAAGTFQLGCTPVVNLFKQRAEPIPLSHTQTEYRVVPDARRPLAAEVYSVDRVTATSSENEPVEFQPFYSFRHAAGRRDQKAFWHATRRPAEQCGGRSDQGTEVYLSLVDLDFKTVDCGDWTMDVETTCLNRDLPHRLTWAEGQSAFRLTRGAPVTQITCVMGRCTQTLRPPLKRRAAWRLISHLSLNHLSLTDYEDGADALREILKLYDFADSAETRAMIDGILSVRNRRVVGRVPGDVNGGFCRGVEVTVQLDENNFVGSGPFLFACVLERFLGLYCSVNSFSKLVAITKQREGEMRRWPPRAGETVLL
jgi:type VI secretion system protein ImpG